MRERGGFALGYTAEAAVNEDHLVVGQRVTQNAADNDSLIPLVKEAERQKGSKAEKVLADAGFFSLDNLQELEGQGLDLYLPDSNSARTEHGKALSANPTECPTAAHAAETALSDGTRRLRPTESLCGTGPGKLERTTWDAAVSVAGIAKGSPRIQLGGDRLQPDPAGRITGDQRTHSRSTGFLNGC